MIKYLAIAIVFIIILLYFSMIWAVNEDAANRTMRMPDAIQINPPDNFYLGFGKYEKFNIPEPSTSEYIPQNMAPSEFKLINKWDYPGYLKP